MNGPPDDDLRRLFAELRRTDEANAPTFRRLLEGGARRRFAAHRRSGWTFATGLAAAATIVAVALSTWSLHRPPRPPGPSSDRIETWRPATEFLLDASFTDLLDTVPALPQPVPDYSSLLTREKGPRS